MWTSITGRVLVFSSQNLGLLPSKSQEPGQTKMDTLTVFATTSLQCQTQPNCRTVPADFKCKLDFFLKKFFMYLLLSLAVFITFLVVVRQPLTSLGGVRPPWRQRYDDKHLRLCFHLWVDQEPERKKDESWCSAFLLSSLYSAWELSPWCGTIHIQGGAYSFSSLRKYPHLSNMPR